MCEARLYRVRLPMRVGFDHPAARRRTSDSLVLSLDVDGVRGIGECAPRPYVTGESSDSVIAALRRLPMDTLLTRLRAMPPRHLLDRLREGGVPGALGVTGGNNLLCLLETAVLDLVGNSLGWGARRLLLGPNCASPSRSLAVSQVLDLSLDVEEFLAVRGPFHRVKVKASGDIERDVRTVRRVRERLGEAVPIVFDANMSWSPVEALSHARRLRDGGVDLLEEPLPPRSWAALRALRRASGVSVMLDESVCTLADARTAVKARACDAVNVRVAKNGGLLGALRLVNHARDHGIGFQVGVQVAEVGPLINAGRTLAFCAPDALAVEAGQSDRFFAEMIVSPRPEVDRRTNTIAPAEGTGLGMVLSRGAERWFALRYGGERAGWQPLVARRSP